MPLSPDDRKTFSLKIVSADTEVATYQVAQVQLAAEVVKSEKLDSANKNLFDPFNSLINTYQLEYTDLDGLTRTTITEQDILDSAAVKINNHFYPNNLQITVPSLSGSNNVWTKVKPFALTYAKGKNYTEGQPVVTKEDDLIGAITTLISSATAYSTIERTSGLQISSTGTCSNPIYTDSATCTLNSGTWTPGPNVLSSYAAVVTLKNNLITAVNALKAFLQTEVTHVVTTDKDTSRQTQNNTAINDINNIIIPALNTWLAYADFNATGVTLFNFNVINPATLAPTKLYPTQLTALNTALTTRSSFVTTRLSQLSTNIGDISQDLTNGDVIASSGLYGQRYGFLSLRLDLLNGSLTKLSGLRVAASAQASIVSSIRANKITYNSVVPTSALAAPGNDTNMIQVLDPSFLSVGDTVFIMAESQLELQRAVKSINGKRIELNDIVPSKYKTTDRLRIYKDLS